VFQRPVAEAKATLSKMALANAVTDFRNTDGYPALKVHGKPDAGDGLTAAIYDLARQHNWPVRELRRDVRTLEMVFNALARGSQAEAVDTAEVAA